MGCIYTNTVLPYSYNFGATPIGTKSCEINNYKVTEPLTDSNMYAEWTTEYILREAKKTGITNIYKWIKKIFSIFGNVFKRDTIIIYGD